MRVKFELIFLSSLIFEDIISFFYSVFDLLLYYAKHETLLGNILTYIDRTIYNTCCPNPVTFMRKSYFLLHKYKDKYYMRVEIFR